VNNSLLGHKLSVYNSHFWKLSHSRRQSESQYAVRPYTWSTGPRRERWHIMRRIHA